MGPGTQTLSFGKQGDSTKIDASQWEERCQRLSGGPKMKLRGYYSHIHETKLLHWIFDYNKTKILQLCTHF